MIKLEVTVEEANLILTALGRLPYEAVSTLIPKLQQQGQEQLQKDDKPQE